MTHEHTQGSGDEQASGNDPQRTRRLAGHVSFQGFSGETRAAINRHRRSSAQSGPETAPAQKPPYRPERRQIAVMTVGLWNHVYKPEETLDRESALMGVAGIDDDTIRGFQRFYVDQANDHLHNQTGPVIVAEPLRRTSNNLEQCQHCEAVFRGEASARIVGAKNATDLTITLDRYNNTDTKSTVAIAEAPKDDTVVVTYTEMDDHLLRVHDQEDDAMRVASKMLELGDYFDGSVELEQPRYMSQ